jgi:alkylation response protein AidB-like acyl-CoA dehydrogenase
VYFALTDEQRALQESVSALLADRFPLSSVLETYDDPGSDGDPDALWKAAGEQGWLAVLVPEEHDGLGLGLLDAAAVARCWGAACGVGPWMPTVVGAELVRLGGDARQRATWLPRVASGEVRLSPALRGDGGRWDADGVAVTADGDRLTGSAVHVEYAHVADRLVVAARDGAGVGLWLVDPAGTGVTVDRHDVLDRSTRVATVTCDGATGERLSGGSAEVLDRVCDRATVLVANDLVGVAREALRRTVAYVGEREQFGRPVGAFQALKHHLADLHVGVTMAEHAGLYAAHALDTEREDARLAVSVAKAKASDAAREATAAMVQYHGGLGYTWEHETHLFFKRAKREEYAYGDATVHRERLAGLVVDTAQGGSR